jgi:hypothetical protein
MRSAAAGAGSLLLMVDTGSGAERAQWVMIVPDAERTIHCYAVMNLATLV